MSPDDMRQIAGQLREMACKLEADAKEADMKQARSLMLAKMDRSHVSMRAYRVLKQLRVEYYEELVNKTAEELQYVRFCGQVTLNEIRAVMAVRGLYLKGEQP
jgi:DNA-directed RNA polymerase alpha subunit